MSLNGVTATIQSMNFVESTLIVALASDPVYFLQPNFTIPFNVWMNITLYIQDASSFTNGIKGCIQMMTLSNITHGIIYDSSSCLDVIGLAVEQDSTAFTIQASYATSDTAKRNTFGASYRAFFDITPNMALDKGGSIILNHEGNFTFDYPCVNTQCVAGATDCTQNISLLNTTTTCQIVNQMNSLYFTVDQFLNQTTFRIAVQIVNPNYFVSSFVANTVECMFESANRAGFLYAYSAAVSAASTNPLSLYTVYPNITLTNIAKLFWGLLPQTDTTKDGCPLTFYAMATSFPIYNSLTTEFTVSPSVVAFSYNGYLKINWFLVNPGSSYTTVIMSSLATTLPVISPGLIPNYIAASDEISITNVGTLFTSNLYYISIKFMLASSAVGVTLTGGKLEVRTGNALGYGEDLLVTLNGPTIPVRLNREYVDTTTTTGWFYGSPPTNYYNFLYSYKSTDYNLASTTLSTLYSTITTAFFSTTSKVGVFVKPSGSTDIYNLFVILYAGQNKICSNGTLATTATCSGSGAASGLHVLLKLIFNNNVLGIDSSLFPLGVLPVGTLFASSTMTNQGCFGYNTASTQSKQMNLITSTTDSAGGVFYHVSLVCLQVPSVDYCHQIQGRSATTIAGLAFVNTSISTFPTLYADTYVFDMILCFKCMLYASFSQYQVMMESFFTLYESTTYAGGPGMIHGYVLQGGPPSGSVAFYANYYSQSASVFGNSNYFATYLRISVTFGTDLPASGTSLAVFLKDNTLAGLQQFANSNNVLNCVEMTSGAQIVGQVIQGNTSTYDMWWQHNGVVLNNAISASTSYNFYIPMKMTSNALTSVYVAVMSQNTLTTNPTYNIIAVYRIIGSVYSSKLATIFSTMNTATLFTDDTTNYNNDPNNGCALPLTGTVPHLNPGTSIIKPYNSISQMAFLSDLGTIGTGTCTCTRALNSGTNWGAIFGIYARTQIFNAAQVLTWDYSGGSTNKCVFHPITNPRAKTTLIYTILCSMDSGGTASSIGTSKNVYINTFIVPFYWGASYNIGDNLQYIWSLNSGLGVSMIRDPTVTTSWTEPLCSVLAVNSVPISTKDIFYTLSIMNVAKYDLPALDNNLVITETLTVGVSTLNYVGCNMIGLTCSYSATATFTLANPSTTNVHSITPNSININILLDTPSTFNATTHSATIKYNGFLTETCSQSSPAGFALNGGQMTNDVILSSLNYVNMANARGAFFFSFTLTRNLRQGNAFYFNLGYFSNGLTTPGIYQCYVLDSTQAKSHLFTSFDASDTTNAKLVLNSNINGGGTYTLKCTGGAQTPNPTVQTSISASYVRVSDGTVITNTILTKEQLNYVSIPNAVNLSTVSLSKKFITRGMDADYLFSFKPVTANVPITGMIYIEFSQAISPYINSMANFECFLNEILVFCGSVAERRLGIIPNIPLLTSSSDNYLLLISGVTQPNSEDSNWQVYFALDNNTNPYDGILEQAYISEPSLNSTAVINSIFLKDMILSNHVIRQLLSIEFQVLLSAGSISTGNQLIVQLPYSFRESIQLTDQLSCSVIKMGDLTSTQLSSSCFKTFNRKIIMFVTDNSNTAALTYRVIISGIYSPQYPTFYNEDVRIFLTSDNITITASTVTCLRNTTEFLTFLDVSTNDTIVELDFFDRNFNTLETIDVYQGSYRTYIGLGPTNGNFPSSFKWNFTNPTNATFYVNPPVMKIDVGNHANFFSIASDNITAPGEYLLTAQKINNTGSIYSDIPALQVTVRTDPCQINTTQNLYVVPYGGRSAPIVLDFSNCLPIGEVDVTANVTVGYDTYYISVEGNQTSTKSLMFSATNTQTQIIFYATSYSLDALSGSPTAIINFSISGNTSYGFLAPAAIQINVIDNSDFQTPPVPMTPIVNPDVGSTTINVGCDQMGTLFYAIGIDNSTNNISYSIIQNMSEFSNEEQTFPDDNDKDYKIYGYEIINVENNAVQVTVNNKLKAGSSYKINTFCLNLDDIPSSSAASATWTQPDNGGKKFKIQFQYNSSLISALKVDMACAFSSYFQINPDRVLTDEGSICQVNTNRRRLDTTTSNSTNTTSNSSSNSSSMSSSNSSSNSTSNTSNTTNTTPTIPTTYSYSWYFSRNYTNASDDLYEVVSSTYSNTGFYSSLVALTTSGSKAFPTLLNSTIVDLSNISNSTTPLLYTSQILPGLSSVSISITITNIDGYIYIGLEPNANSSIPGTSQLKQGMDGNNSYLTNWAYAYVPSDVSQPFNFISLANGTYYSLYYMASNDDLTEDGLMTSVIVRTFYTFSRRIEAFCLWVLMMLAIIFF